MHGSVGSGWARRAACRAACLLRCLAGLGWLVGGGHGGLAWGVGLGWLHWDRTMAHCSPVLSAHRWLAAPFGGRQAPFSNDLVLFVVYVKYTACYATPPVNSRLRERMARFMWLAS